MDRNTQSIYNVSIKTRNMVAHCWVSYLYSYHRRTLIWIQLGAFFFAPLPCEKVLILCNVINLRHCLYYGLFRLLAHEYLFELSFRLSTPFFCRYFFGKMWWMSPRCSIKDWTSIWLDKNPRAPLFTCAMRKVRLVFCIYFGKICADYSLNALTFCI